MIAHKATVLATVAILVVVALLGTFYLLRQTSSGYDWEGYWGSCNKGDPEADPLGFFSTHFENWQQSACEIKSIDRAKTTGDYDLVNLYCESKEGEAYDQVIGLRINSKGELLVVWPGGVGFRLPKCKL